MKKIIVGWIHKDDVKNFGTNFGDIYYIPVIHTQEDKDRTGNLYPIKVYVSVEIVKA